MLGLFTGSVGRSAAATHDWTDNREHCWGEGALSGGRGPVVLVNACRRTKEFRNVWVGSLRGRDDGDVGVSNAVVFTATSGCSPCSPAPCC